MFEVTGRSIFKSIFLSIFFLGFSLVFFPNVLNAQVTPPEDQPIDPNQLKNATPSQLDQLQRYLQDKNQTQQNPGADLNHPPNVKNKTISKDSILKDDFRKKIRSTQDVYGEDLFWNGSVMELSELSTPPLDYPIGVGDHIVVALWGGADFETDYVVARDGSIFPQGLGKITVQGLTFENARSVITDRFRRVIPLSTNISVTMGQPRTIVVNASGEVGTPGPVVVSAFSNALNVIALAGGLNEFGNLRNIIIKRNGRVIDSLDVYKYLTRGDFGKHLYLDNNDFIIVPPYDKKVFATGQFRRPMYYQLKQGEGFSDLLRFSGGFTPDAYASGGIIQRNVNEKQTIKNVNFNAIGLKVNGKAVDEELFDGDIVIVPAINQGLSNKVLVKGEVAYPNVYEIRKGDRLFDVINRAGGVTPNAYLPRAYVFKGAGDSANLKSDRIDVSLNDLNKNFESQYNIPIDANDVIEIFNRNQFADRQYVSIEGEVRSPKDRQQKYGGMTLKDLIYLAGGLKPSAEFGRIEVASIVDIDSAQKGLKPTKTVIKSYSILPNLELDSVTENVILKPYDQVFVRKNPTFELQQNVSLDGEIKYPGTYTRLNKYERISSYITRAGGLKDNANVGGAILYRNKSIGVRQTPFGKIPSVKYVRDTTGKIVDSVVFNPEEPISIDLYKALKYKNSKYDLILQEGDVVYVPEINPFVNIKGAVQSSLKIAFDKEHTGLSYYIDKAGGFGVRPWRKRVYVTYANGKSKRTRNFGFFHFYPRVEEGSIVVVPSRPEGKDFADFASQVLVTAMPIFVAFILTRL